MDFAGVHGGLCLTKRFGIRRQNACAGYQDQWCAPTQSQEPSLGDSSGETGHHYRIDTRVASRSGGGGLGLGILADKNNPFSVCLCQRYESEKPLQNMRRVADGFIVWLGGARHVLPIRRKAFCNDERTSCRLQSQREDFLVFRRVIPRVERRH